MTNRMVNDNANASPHISLSGCLLVAAPDWQNEVFQRTVCMVVHHGPQGAIGIVLNRGMQAESKALLQHLAGEQGHPRSGLLHFGGPHSGPVVALHNCNAFAEFESAEGVYVAAQIQNLRALISTPEEACAVKIMVGQADWAAGQLDHEFQQGRWLPLPVTPELVFADDHRMWPQAMLRIGDCFVAGLTGAIQPPNLQAN
ncbi:MAG: YqgE/AlgH family protein [bacterium]|nr:YqgE/AlgH family protein [bacterium]